MSLDVELRVKTLLRYLELLQTVHSRSPPSESSLAASTQAATAALEACNEQEGPISEPEILSILDASLESSLTSILIIFIIVFIAHRWQLAIEELHHRFVLDKLFIVVD